MNPKIQFALRFVFQLLGAVSLLVSINASAQNLFVASSSLGSFIKTPGTVYEYTPGGVRSTFASVSPSPHGLAFDAAGNLFVTTGVVAPGGLTSAIDEYT